MRRVVALMALIVAGCQSGNPGPADALTSTRLTYRLSRVVATPELRLQLVAKDVVSLSYLDNAPTDIASAEGIMTALDEALAQREPFVAIADGTNPDEDPDGLFLIELRDASGTALARTGTIALQSEANRLVRVLKASTGGRVFRDYWMDQCGLDVLSADGGFTLNVLSASYAIRYATPPYDDPAGAKQNVARVFTRMRDPDKWTTFLQPEGNYAVGVTEPNGTAMLLGVDRFADPDQAIETLSEGPTLLSSYPDGCRAR